MTEPKTIPTDESVAGFLNGIADPTKRQDSLDLVELMRTVSGQEPTLWGANIVGFGNRHYKYATGREGDTFEVGFAPRKDALTLYVSGYLEFYGDLLQRLGKHKTGKGCLYIKKLQDVNMDVLREIVAQSVANARQAAE